MADPTAEWPRVDVSRDQRVRERWRHRRPRGAPPSPMIPVDVPPRAVRSRIAPVVDRRSRRRARLIAIGVTAAVVVIAAAIAWGLPRALVWLVRSSLLPLAG